MSDDGTNWESSGSRFSSKQIIGLVAVAVFLVFVFQNSAQGEIGFLWFNAQLPVWVFFLIVFALGWIAGWFAHGRSKKSG